MLRLLLGVALLERIWKHLLISRFFRRAQPTTDKAEAAFVSILQPILSGDPALEEGLRLNLEARSSYRREFIWLVDTDDLVGQQICTELIDTHPKAAIQLVLMPPPALDENPKLIKLIEGSTRAQGSIICVLDDDTRLPDDGLEQCLPQLEQPGVGLAFGLPYYISFDNLWSSLVASFVNSQSLLTYVPYASISEPFTINGMFYAIKRDVLEKIGGFHGLEHIVADDFAVAQRLRSHGYRLAQTPLRHAIRTTVDSPAAYMRLIQRWFIFPRESLMRHLSLREQILFYSSTVAPIFASWLAFGAALRGKGLTRLLGIAYCVYCQLLFQHLNKTYLDHATPKRWFWLIPLLQLSIPFQISTAMLSPQRIIWRGHVIEIEEGGNIRTIQRREG